MSTVKTMTTEELVAAVVEPFVNAALIMVALGILHDDIPTIPAIGYWAAAGIAILLDRARWALSYTGKAKA